VWFIGQIEINSVGLTQSDHGGFWAQIHGSGMSEISVGSTGSTLANEAVRDVQTLWGICPTNASDLAISGSSNEFISRVRKQSEHAHFHAQFSPGSG
jgi:hypothetical protein